MHTNLHQFFNYYSADFDMSGDNIVSCGMDHSLKIWSFNTKQINESIQLSYEVSLELF